MFLDSDAAVVEELQWRDQEKAEGACALAASTRSGCSTPVVLYPKQYTLDVARIQKELNAEDHFITKPSRGEKLV